ncbi:MAG: adenylate/guanylate cyclase domain-containing protein, partial [Bdellovibrionales bacterium]|nr:adenylate/guanylate cyclase domain-containing protein [Bdellovibrionales bacterium]
YLADIHILFADGYVVNISLPILTVFAVFVSTTSYKYFTEERKKRALKGTFAKYVSPAVVDEILKDPENIELGGKKVELTVMFSDVRGFTTISEKLDPRALSDLLNSYLTPMTDLVFETRGTLDKYMGDAIMAFWGAPIHFDDHAERAAHCALLMIKKLKELQQDYATRGLPAIDIGIGLNTGDMSVGNMGSNTVRSYTVMGDSVNLGSRLEGINKEYGTRIIVSEFTHAKIAKNYVTREVDWVRVKGKVQPVRIFELIGTKSPMSDLAASSEMLALLPDFETGFRLYHQRNFAEAVTAFTQALNAKPDDFCSQLYIDRCQEYLDNPPPLDWDGVYTMKTK